MIYSYEKGQVFEVFEQNASSTINKSDTISVRSIAGNTNLILIPELGSKWVHVAAIYGVGSRDDPAERTGLAHWLEHALCRRYHRGDYARPLSASLFNGGYFSAFTLYDYTCYYSASPVEQKYISLDLEVRRMGGFEISSEELDKDRTIIDAERSYQETFVAVRVGELTEQMAFIRHPYKWPPIGWREHLNAVCSADLINCYRANYRPDNLILVMCGDFNEKRVEDYWSNVLAKSSLSNILQKICKTPPPQEPIQKEYRLCQMKDYDAPPYIHILFKTPPSSSRYALPILVLVSALAGAKTSFFPFVANSVGQEASILYRALVETEIAFNIKCGYRRSLDPHAFDIMVTLKRGVDIYQVFRIIRHELERIGSEGLRDDELAHAKSCVRAAFRFRFESSLGKVLEYGHSYATGAYGEFVNLDTKLEKIRGNNIVDVCKRYLQMDHATIGMNLSCENKKLKRGNRA